MDSIKQCVVIIPAYQPDSKLVSLLEEIKSSTDYSVVIVNDGSFGESLAVIDKAKEYGAVLNLPSNSGKGMAIRKALAYVGDNFSADAVIVTMDADGQHKLSDAIKLCKTAGDSSGKLVIGSRVFSGKVPLRSRFGNTVTRFVYKVVTGIKVKDTQTGLRAFGAGMIPFMLKVEGSRYEYEMNVLLECSRQKVPIIEVPIETVYINDNASSHFDTVKDSFRIYKEIFKFCASSLISFLIDFCVYSLMILLTRPLTVAVSIPMSNIVARIISSSFNFYINKKYVFNNKDSLIKTALKYFALAGGILFANTLLLTVLVKHVIGNEFTGKIIVEAFLFIVSWLVQRFLIFKKHAQGETKA